MFTLICARINGWVNNLESGDLRRYRTHYDVIVMNCVIIGSRTMWISCHSHALKQRLDEHHWHYDDVIMSTMASQITSLMVVYSTVYSDADQRKHQSSASLAFVWGIHRDWWIPRTKGQLRGKCFHLMTSSWSNTLSTLNTFISSFWIVKIFKMLRECCPHRVNKGHIFTCAIQM